MPVNNATDLGQTWVIVHHKRDTALTFIFVTRFLTLQICPFANVIDYIRVIAFLSEIIVHKSHCSSKNLSVLLFCLTLLATPYGFFFIICSLWQEVGIR